MREQTAVVQTNGISRIFMKGRGLLAVILSGILLSVSVFPLVRSISTPERPHFISYAHLSSVQVIPLLFMNTSHEPYRATYKGEDDSFDVHTIADRIEAIHRNIFLGRTGKTLNNIIQVTGVPSEEYILRKNPVKVYNALLPARFFLLIDGCIHNNSPPSARFIS